MLNDLSRFTRLATFLQTLSGGLLIGMPFGLDLVGVDGFPVAAGVILALVLVSLAVWMCFFLVTVRGGNTRLLDDAAAGAAEVGAGRTRTGPAVPGRVVRTRLDRKGRTTTVPGVAGPVRADLVAVLTVLPPGAPARRVAVLAPGTLLGALTKGSHHGVLLDPARTEVGVLDGRATAADRDRFAHDPRWQENLPTDRTVAGGYLPVVGCAVLGLVAGVGISLAISVLASLG